MLGGLLSWREHHHNVMPSSMGKRMRSYAAMLSYANNAKL